MTTHLVWFRNDLRTIHQPALSMAAKQHKVKAVFWVTMEQWQSHQWGHNKINFVLRHVIELQRSLKKLNIPLDIEKTQNFTTLPEDFLDYAKKLQCSDLYFNLEYELNERLRDQAIKHLFSENNIHCHSYHDQMMLPPNQIMSQQQSPYKVFTPFKRAWVTSMVQKNICILAAPDAQPKQLYTQGKSLPKKIISSLNDDIQNQWPVGENYAIGLLESFCEKRVENYQAQRDFPNLKATSSLSPYLAVGALSPHQCLMAAINQNQGKLQSGHPGVLCWISELIWREFYRYIVFHHPRICKHENFNQQYNAIAWNQDQQALEKWQQGQTGIPIVDAAMRQLVQTGWMHNRLRMVTAMFLTKNLLMDWRHGEAFFSEHLIDLDFASNNGGWQWSASTGTDAAPYFRVFNPLSQSMRFDPAGEFIKYYCPELKMLPAKLLHNPKNFVANREHQNIRYPAMMLDLKTSRQQAIDAFRNCK